MKTYRAILCADTMYTLWLFVEKVGIDIFSCFLVQALLPEGLPFHQFNIIIMFYITTEMLHKYEIRMM